MLALADGHADWADVIIAAIGVFPSSLAAWFAYRTHRNTDTGNAHTLGQTARDTHQIITRQAQDETDG